RKIEFGADGEGILSIWSGLLVETPPGFGAEVRPLGGALGSPVFSAEPAVLATDLAPRDLVIRLKFRLTDRWVHIRTADAVAHLLPIRRETFDADWLLGQLPIEAGKDAIEVYRRWRAGG